MYIFCRRALASYRCRPLSSNVRPHRPSLWRSTRENPSAPIGVALVYITLATAKGHAPRP